MCREYAMQNRDPCTSPSKIAHPGTRDGGAVRLRSRGGNTRSRESFSHGGNRLFGKPAKSGTKVAAKLHKHINHRPSRHEKPHTRQIARLPFFYADAYWKCIFVVSGRVSLLPELKRFRPQLAGAHPRSKWLPNPASMSRRTASKSITSNLAIAARTSSCFPELPVRR